MSTITAYFARSPFFRCAAIAVAVAGLLTPADRAAAQERPYSSRGTLQLVIGTGVDFVGFGHATHLGRYTEAGNLVLNPTADPTVFLVSGSSVYTAASGDQLEVDITGTISVLPGPLNRLLLNLSFTGGTGRFAQATGSANSVSLINPDGTGTVVADGLIDY